MPTPDPAAPFPVRVYYEDTDAGGIVYHANYLKFAERARTEWLRLLDTNHRALAADHGVLFAVKNLHIDYRGAARLDDLLAVGTEITACGAATLDMRQIIRHEDKIMAVLAVKLVTITAAGKPARLPDWLRREAMARMTASLPP